jgi:flavorubredoxin
MTLHGDVSDYHLAFPQFADRLRPMVAGDSLDLGNRWLTTLDSVIRDLRTTLWLFDERERVLFPGDGLAYSHFHEQGHCGLLAEEAQDLDLKDVSAVYAERALFWTKFADMNVYIEEFERMVDALDVRLLAPTHGLPVGDIERTMPKVMEGLLFGAEAEMTAQGDLAQGAAR